MNEFPVSSFKHENCATEFKLKIETNYKTGKSYNLTKVNSPDLKVHVVFPEEQSYCLNTDVIIHNK